MRALSRLVVTALIVFTLIWLKGQFEKLRQSVLELDRLSQDGGFLSHTGHEASLSNADTPISSNGTSSAQDDPFKAIMHAISNSLISDTIEDMATAKSAFRDGRHKTVVVARTTKENTHWVPLLLPNWQHAIYVTDNHNAPLHTARNKGREANAYLTYIIENYSNLPTTIAFIHSHISSWHNDQNAARALQLLNIDFVQSSGYINFRCHHDPGCPAEIQPFRNRKENGKSDEREAATELAFAAAWKHLFNTTDVPEQVGVACCAQFAVSGDQVLKRPKSDYIWFHDWLMNTSLNDEISGRVFEYVWHVIFGKDPTYCPSLHECYANVYDQWSIR